MFILYLLYNSLKNWIGIVIKLRLNFDFISFNNLKCVHIYLYMSWALLMQKLSIFLQDSHQMHEIQSGSKEEKKIISRAVLFF